MAPVKFIAKGVIPATLIAFDSDYSVDQKNSLKHLQDVATIDGFLGMVQQRVGPQLLNVLIKQDEVAKFVAKKLGIPEELIRSSEEMQQAAQQMQQMMAQQQGGIEQEQSEEIQ